jgi:Ca2+-dependent lipid-binding protein
MLRSAPSMSTAAITRLTIVVREGHGLANVRSGGHCTPFCELRVGGQRVKTKAMPNTQDPAWADTIHVKRMPLPPQRLSHQTGASSPLV